MRITKRKFQLGSIIIVLAYTALWSACGEKIKTEKLNATWPIYKGDAESTSFANLKEINKENVHLLKRVWEFDPMDNLGSDFSSSECNPIVINNVMYALSARHRVYAVDASTGKQKWAFDPFNGAIGGGVGRGVTYWEDGEDHRILFTAGDHLFALNANTGTLIASFGDKGKVSMNQGLRGDPEKIKVIPTSPGIIYKDLLILGTEVSELYGAEPGYIRAYDVRTGKLIWTFHTIPWPGEIGYDTWPKDAWKYTGGANNWGGMSLDEGRGMVFLSTGSPTYDYYGADRKGQNLFGNSVVALDANTGKYIWHFQTIHHDLWDYDLPAPPNLVTVKRNGSVIDAVAQVSKVGFLYLLDRKTGKPLFPIEERPVPASHLPGEVANPTQPFPLLPKPFARQHLSEVDLMNYGEGSYDSILQRFRSFRYEGLFTPPDTIETLMFPGSRGGAEWGGAAFDPLTNIIYVRSSDSPEIISMKYLQKRPTGSPVSLYEGGKTFYMNYCVACHGADRNGDEFNYPSLIGLSQKFKPADVLQKIRTGGGKMPAFGTLLKGHEEEILAFLLGKKAESPLSVDDSHDEAADTGYFNTTAYSHFYTKDRKPAIRPPWGTLNAINLNTGDYVWKIPIGNMPAFQSIDADATGTEGSGGPIVTAGGLVFIGSTRDKKFRAIDKDSGKILWEFDLPAVANATPCTYAVNGRQFVAVSVGGYEKHPAGTIVTFALH